MPGNLSRRQPLTSSDAAQRIAEQARRRRANPTRMWGVAPYGFSTLAQWTGGIQKEDMIIVAARPNVGKSAWAGQVAESVARHFKQTESDKWVKIITTEMSAEQCLNRLVCAKAGLNPWKISSGYNNDLEWTRYQRSLQYF